MYETDEPQAAADACTLLKTEPEPKTPTIISQIFRLV